VKIKSLKLQNWRNHKKLSFEFSDITVLVGPNAKGKTNFLEAIHYLSTGKSFRAKDESLIGWEEDFSRVEADIKTKEGEENLLLVLEKSIRVLKTVKIKEQKVASSKLLGHLGSVLFTPEEIELISTLPEARRRYLNMIISQSERRYAYSLIHFRRTLEQRNSLLRRIFNGEAKEEELEIWDGKFAEYSDQIITARAHYISEINKHLEKHYQRLSGSDQKLSLQYLPSISETEGWAGIVTRLTQSRSRDIQARVTTIGPHRDDMAFIMDGRNLLTFASRGELRTVILALKLAEVDFLETVRGERPVLLLDDVFSELDSRRRDLLSQVFTEQQTIVTTTDLDHISKNILEKANIIELSDGK
jgi:DNA replication and repair protein RecF